jgi:hypothetical protein
MERERKGKFERRNIKRKGVPSSVQNVKGAHSGRETPKKFR